MQPASLANLDLLERNLFLPERDLTEGLELAGVCNVGFLSPERSPCAPLPRCSGGGTCSRSPRGCWGRFLASHASPVHPPLEQFGVSLVACIPDLFLREI